LFLSQAGFDPSDHLTTGLHLPNAITAHDDEVEAFVFYLCYLRIGSDHLLLCRELFAALILEVAYCSGKIKVSIDAAIVYGPSSL